MQDYKITYSTNGVQKTFDSLLVNIGYDERDLYEWDDLRSFDIKIDIKEHRRYSFQKDFDIDYEYLEMDFSDYTEEEKENSQDYEYYKENSEKYKEICEKYYVFWLDFFDHSVIGFSLSCERMDLGYYNWDRSTNVWIIAVDKNAVKDYKDALQAAKLEVEAYNAYINWRLYEFRIDEKELYYSKDLKKTLENYDFYEWYGCFIREEDAEKEALEIVKAYMNEKGIEYDTVELVEN